ncbi:MAG: hypothetical protein M3552_03025 [Planctomycetota bacterium]|nr:hypothetical protein [Planctomycetota bacterium]
MRELLIGIEASAGNPVPEWSGETEIPGIGRIRPVQPLGFEGIDVLNFALAFASSVGASVLADWITHTLREKGQRAVVIARRRVELESDKVRVAIEEELAAPENAGDAS